ncbi:MAG: PEP-CTERM sorting domain-containing protein [Pseudomonadota bacterium]
MNIAKKVLPIMGLLASFGFIAAAHAAIITDTVNPVDRPITTSSSYTYTHNIAEDGYVLGTPLAAGGTLTFHLTDPSGANETYQFSIGLAGQISIDTNVPGGDGELSIVILNAASLLDLQSDGLLNVTVSSTNGNFSFADSVLSVSTIEAAIVPAAVAAVPEPLTIALFGLGLFGLGVSRKRMQ